MIKKTIAVIFIVTLSVCVGRCEEDPEKGKLYYFPNPGIVAQTVKDGVLLWSRSDVANKKTWRDAKTLFFLRKKDTRGYKKGMEFGSAWMKYIGRHRHGNLLVGYRSIDAFQLPTREEIEQAEYEENRRREEEGRRREEESRQHEIVRLKALEQKRFEEGQLKIKEQAEQERIKRELQRQREENDRKLAAERAKSEIEAERQRQEEARRAEEERKRRYPIEQRERAEYAKEMLSKISFDINSYFDMQRDVRRFIYSVSVTEKKWSLLKELQAKGDWLGMLNAMSETEMQDYPAQAQIATIIENLKKTGFHAEFLFTHQIEWDSMCVGVVDLEGWNRIRDFHPLIQNALVRINADKAGFIVLFSMSAREKEKPLLHASPSNPREDILFKNRTVQLAKIKSDVELGKITKSEAEKRERDIDEEFWREFSIWLETSKIPDGVFPVRVRERSTEGRSLGRGTKSVAQNGESRPQMVTCPDCNGSRYISKGRCEKCNGEGRYRTAIKRGIGGRAMGGRTTQCDKCKGKGEIKELCSRCRGYGKIRQ